MTKTIAALSAAVLTLGIAGPAAAAGIATTDLRDTSHGSDLLSVQVNNKARGVVVVTTHTDLRPDPRTGSAGEVYLDTDRHDPGPEFVFVGGYFDGTDYQLLHTEGFDHRTWGAPAEGYYEMTVDYAKDRVRMRMSDKALDEPGNVRVAVRVSGTRRDGSTRGLVDWLDQRHSFTRWVTEN